MNKQGITVLSLFDGLSGGRIALEKAGIKVVKYYSSEIDKFAIQIANKNYPNDIRLGSVIDLTDAQLLDMDIDLLIGGSPCQGFSVSGKMKGSSTKCGVDILSLEQYLQLKKENFEFEGQSYLFWEFVRVWKIVKPKFFFLENVRVTKKWLPMFNEAMGVEPIIINSALVSAQNRVRFYWTNIPNIVQPDDKKILLRDILNQQDLLARPCELRGYNEDSICHHIADATDIKGQESLKRVYSKTGKSPTLTTMQGGHRQPKVLIVPEATKKGYTEIQDGDCFDYSIPNSKTRRGRNMKDKSNCLQTSNGFMRYEHPTYRKLTPMECERLQTIPDGYTDGVSNSQRYKMIGNGWTIDVVAHIFKNIV